MDRSEGCTRTSGPGARATILLAALLAVLPAVSGAMVGTAGPSGPMGPDIEPSDALLTPRFVVKSVTTLISNGARPEFGPPSTGMIAFDKKESDGFYDIYTAQDDGTGAACLTCNHTDLPNRNMGRAAWHPAGEFIAFQAEKRVHPVAGTVEPGGGHFNDLWAIRMSDKKGFQLTNLTVSEDQGSIGPRFSADGTKACWAEMFVRPNIFVRGQEFGHWKVKVADFAVESGVPLLRNAREVQPWGPAFFACAGFSPAGDRILYVSNPLQDGYVWERLALYSHDLSAGTQLKLSTEGFNAFASHTRDGSAVMWVTNREVTNGGTDYWTVEADGTRPSRATYLNQPGHPHYLGRKFTADQFSFSAANDRALAMAWTSDAPAEERISEIVFVPIGSVSGKVTDSSGLNLAGAKVEAFYMTNGSSAGFTTTAAGGDYWLDLPAPTDFRIDASLSGFELGTASAKVEPWKRLSLDFVLLKPGEGTIKGVAKDRETGAALAGGVVKAESGASSNSATADTNGVFEMNVKPGTYTLTLSANGYENSSLSGIKSGDKTVKIEATMIRIKSSSISDGATGIPTDLAVKITFSVPMDRASVESSTSLSPAATLSFTWTDDTTVAITTHGLAPGTAHVLKVASGAKAKAGGAMTADGSVKFTTAGGFLPGDPGGALSMLLILAIVIVAVALSVAVVLVRRRRKPKVDAPAFFPKDAPAPVAQAGHIGSASTASPDSKAGPVATAGVNTLFLGGDANLAYEALRQLTVAGGRGLILSTSMPAKLKASRKLENAEVLWITDKSGPGKVQATRLEFEIQKAVNEFYQRGPGGVLMVDGVDYLLARAGPRVVTEFLKRTADTAAEKGGTLLATLDPAAVQAEQLAVLKRGFDKVEDGK